ncbi:MAG TPA: TIGR03857 family LLM class F420-dependent oxidoreductase [Acidimicrobiales bacterium]|nr:TIGR03857 family LLM class F420-dependent oxidoreductase [Acidimicrobiales bacterium]
MTDRLVELGCYGLAGHVDDPAVLLDEVRDAERVGLGSVFLSERFALKELGALSGAAVAVSDEVGVATGVTNHPTRHPMVTASWATTLHRMSRGRFALGIGRGITPLMDAVGVPRITMAQMEDAIGVWRRLWRGETILGHDGPAGRWPFLRLDPTFDEDIPVMVAALGHRTMEWAGGVADGVILHTFVTDEALAEAVASIRRGAERAGRDPERVRVWSVLATLHEPDEERRLRGLIGRMATYLQVYGDALVSLNHWDHAVLERFRADETVRAVPGAIDAVASLDQLRRIAELIPDTWLPAAVGSAEGCAARVVEQFDAGADGVILHGSGPVELAPVVDAYRPRRPEGRFVGRVPNPGR